MKTLLSGKAQYLFSFIKEKIIEIMMLLMMMKMMKKEEVEH